MMMIRWGMHDRDANAYMGNLTVEHGMEALFLADDCRKGCRELASLF
jgi:hypothetical protein